MTKFIGLPAPVTASGGSVGYHGYEVCCGHPRDCGDHQECCGQPDYPDAHEVATTSETYAPLIARAINAYEPMLKALRSAEGYLLNAKIDLQTGTKKATTLNTIEGGLKMVREAIAAATGGSCEDNQ